MAFVKYKGKTVVRWLPVTTSTTFTKGDIVAWSSGLLIKATSSTAAKDHVGVIKKTIAATDSDYATARKVPVEIPVEKRVLWRGPATALVAADIGLWIDLTDAGTADRANSTIDALSVEDVLSSTVGLFVLNLGGAVNNIN